MRYWSRGPVMDATELRDYMKWNVGDGKVRCVAITRRDREDDALGWVVLFESGSGGAEAEIGFILRPDAQGQGLAREALRACLAHDDLGARYARILADVDPENASSIRLLEALGFHCEAHVPANIKTHLGWRDSLIYVIELKR